MILGQLIFTHHFGDYCFYGGKAFRRNARKLVDNPITTIVRRRINLTWGLDVAVAADVSKIDVPLNPARNLVANLFCSTDILNHVFLRLDRIRA